MSIATEKLLTAEEFARLPDPPDESRQELVRGVIETMPPAGGWHGVCCAKVMRLIGKFVDESNVGTATSNNSGIVIDRDPDTVRGPDVAFWSKERLPEIPEGYIEVPPDLVVEVVLPSDHFSRINRKIREYLDKGVRLVWVVDPKDRSVTVYCPGRGNLMLTEKDTLDGEMVLPGFSCRVADLFPG
ncbi:MAG: Uma2 family endonuclease [Gemmataceae bacterium]